ncbi:MAG TPA: enoyl-ACP reductase FabI [Thermoleophilaceae bacterium]|jgi:enoyl-[acyl-carrier protein] reductase I
MTGTVADTGAADRAAAMAGAAAAGGRLLEGKRIVITGVATRHSIAFKVAETAQLLGAELVLTSFGRMMRLTERAARQLPKPLDVLELDADSPADYERLTDDLQQRWGAVDGALHAIAYAPVDALGGNFLTTPPESAERAFRTSAYSFKALGAALAPLMPRGGSLVGLDFDATRAWPTYDWMGVAKAALESVGRYLARDLGPSGIRVNLVSCGPLKTMAAQGIPSFQDLCETWDLRAPLGWDTGDAEVVAGPVCFLMSDLARAISGEILHVDGGFNAIGAKEGVRN